MDSIKSLLSPIRLVDAFGAKLVACEEQSCGLDRNQRKLYIRHTILPFNFNGMRWYTIKPNSPSGSENFPSFWQGSGSAGVTTDGIK